MRIPCRLTRRADAVWTARHESADLGRIETSAPTREEALQKLHGEVRYRLELCPCSGESYQHVELTVEAE